VLERWIIAAVLVAACVLSGGSLPVKAQRTYEVIVRNPEVVHDRRACGGASYRGLLRRAVEWPP
jgi:hypothetical protein